MKKNSTILFLLISLSTFAQFPAPTNFTLDGKYVLMGNCEFCLSSTTICGPSSCSTYSWQAPSGTTTATLDHYVIYGKDYSNNITFNKTVTGATSYWSNTGIVGNFYVTAVYTNPAGESLPSNIVVGWPGYPTENRLVQSAKENIILNYSEQILTINTEKTIIKINLISSNGRVLKCIQSPSKTNNISALPKGFYIVEIYCENTDVQRQKIIK